jgi:hypothetical protein
MSLANRLRVSLANNHPPTPNFREREEMFSGVSFTIKLANGTTFTPTYEVHSKEGLSNIITETFSLCNSQGANVLEVNVA